MKVQLKVGSPIVTTIIILKVGSSIIATIIIIHIIFITREITEFH